MVRPSGISSPKTAERDTALWLAWLDGSTQTTLAAAHGMTQQAVSDALRRSRGTLPVPDYPRTRMAGLTDALARLDAIIERHWPSAIRDGDIDAGRLVLDCLATRSKLLGHPTLAVIRRPPDPTPEQLARLELARARNAARLAQVKGALPCP